MLDAMKSHIICREIDNVAVPMLDLEGPLKTKQGLRPKDQHYVTDQFHCPKIYLEW